MKRLKCCTMLFFHTFLFCWYDQMGFSSIHPLVCMWLAPLPDPWLITNGTKRNHWRKEHTNIPYQSSTAWQGTVLKTREVNCKVCLSILTFKFFQRGLIFLPYKTWPCLCIIQPAFKEWLVTVSPFLQAFIGLLKILSCYAEDTYYSDNQSYFSVGILMDTGRINRLVFKGCLGNYNLVFVTSDH